MADKKILDEELMSDDELDQVAGGNTQETLDLINAIGVVSEHTNYGTGQKFYTQIHPTELESYLKKTYGIDATIHFEYEAFGYDGVSGRKANEYSLNGKSLTHQQVLKMVGGK